jgi:RHS repeat-associated protein
LSRQQRTLEYVHVFPSGRPSAPGCSNFAQIATPTGATFSDTGLTASTSYSYRVRATDAAGNLSGYSGVASATTQPVADTTPPTAPTGLSASVASASQIDLSWTPSTDNVGVAGYQIDRCQGAGCSAFTQIATSSAAGFSDTGLAASTTYRYQVRASDAAGNVSANSSIVTATTQAAPDTTPPTAPAGLGATAASASQINLSWAASSDNVGVTGYRVERCAGAGCSGFAQIATPTGTSFSDTGLTPATSYSYRVRAADAAGNLSAYSNVASASTQGGQLYYIVPDHLNTPRMIANQQGTTVWKWDQAEPFGASAPNADADGDGVGFDFPLRFPGQYFDKETGLHYNDFRDYDSILGRYVESDPIGLEGGINTYLYVKGNPIGYLDPEGLFLIAAHAMSRDPEVAENATVISSVGTGAGVATIGTVGVGVVAGYTPSVIAGVATVPEVAAACYRILKSDPCKNAILAAALGANICGNASGTVKGSAREYVRTRERLQEIRDASERASRANGTTGIIAP